MTRPFSSNCVRAYLACTPGRRPSCQIGSQAVNPGNARLLISPVIPPHPSTPDDHWLSRFPLRTFLELGAYDSAAGSARGHARNVLAEWGLADFTDAVTLVVSEMI